MEWLEETDMIASSVSVFKIKSNVILDTLIQKVFFQRMKIHNFQDDLTDISAKKKH